MDSSSALHRRLRPAKIGYLWVLVALGAWGCSGDVRPPRAEPVFRIGALALFDGVKADGSGIPTLEGARMAAQELNEAGGIDVGGVRHRIEIVERRHPFRVEEVTTAARSLINRDSVHALVGPQYSQHAIPVGAIAERAGVPMISPMSSSPATTEGRSFVFRIAFLDAAQGEALARYAREELGLDRAAVVRSLTSPYSSDVADRFVQVFRELGGEITQSSFPGGGPEVVQAAFQEVLLSRPERVLLPLQTEEVTEILEFMEAQGVKVGLLGTDSWDTAMLQGHASAQDAYLANQWMWTMPDAAARGFGERYRTAHGDPPRSTAALSYDAVRILASAATASGSLDGAALRGAITRLPPHDGVSGRIHFDGSSNPSRPVILSRIVDGRATFVTAVDIE
jgi:branched-chain amino acid transport system substrate-binding protein